MPAPTAGEVLEVAFRMLLADDPDLLPAAAACAEAVQLIAPDLARCVVERYGSVAVEIAGGVYLGHGRTITRRREKPPPGGLAGNGPGRR